MFAVEADTFTELVGDLETVHITCCHTNEFAMCGAKLRGDVKDYDHFVTCDVCVRLDEKHHAVLCDCLMGGQK